MVVSRFQSAIVTGAGRGLGAAIAQALAQDGAHVLLVARTRSELDTVALRIRSSGGRATAYGADITDKHAVHGIVAAAEAYGGPVDLLVNNAGALGTITPLLESDCETLESVLATNVIGPFRLTKIVLGAMALRQRGTVLNISSDAAVNVYAGWSIYGASKAAADQLFAHIDVEHPGLRRLTFDPGEMDTRMHAEAVPDLAVEALASLARPSVVAERILDLLRAGTTGRVAS